MAAGAFDPADFAAFKSQSGGGAQAAPIPVSSPLPAFDPSEFEAFKAGSAAPAAGSDPGALQIRVGGRPRQDAPNPFQPSPAPVATSQAAMTPEAFDARFYGDDPVSAPMASTTDTRSGLGSALQAKADASQIGAPSLGNDVLTGLLNAGQSASLNIMGNAAAGVATGLGAYNNSDWRKAFNLPAASGYSPRPFSENYQRFKDIAGAHDRQSPKSAIAGMVGGALATAPLLPAWTGPKAAMEAGQLVQKTGLLGRAGRAGVTAAGYGGAASLIDTKDPIDAGIAAGIGGAAGSVLSPVVEVAAPVIGKSADRLLQKFGFRAPPAPRTTFSSTEEAALQAAGADPAQLSADQNQRFLDAFKLKGVSPAVVREAQAAEFGIPLSRGQATGDFRTLLTERGSVDGRQGAKAQEIGQDFRDRQTGAILSAREIINQTLAGKRPTIDNPTAAFEGVADAARRFADDTAARAAAAQRQADQALGTVRGANPSPDPIEAASMVGQSIRDAATAGRAGYRAAYDEVAAIPGQFTPGALDRIGTRVRDRLGADVPVDDMLTPAATRALADLDDLPGLFKTMPGEGPTLQQLDQMRKRLVALRGNTTMNPTDRRAMDRVLHEFDSHVEDAMAVGQFGPRSAAPTAPVDDSPGFALSGVPDPAAAVPGAAGGASRGRQGQPQSLVDYLALNGGIPLDADTRAADLNRAYLPGRGTLARRDAPSWDAIRVRLSEQRFFPPDEMGAASAQDVADKVRDLIQAERLHGRKTFRMGEEAGAGGRAADHVADQNADHLAMVDRQRRRIEIDMEGYGLRPHELDRTALDDAADMMVRGEADDAATAYDRAVARRPDPAAAPPRGFGDEAPFPELGQGVGAAASDEMPIADMAPLQAMRNARGQFSQYQRTFRPRGPGDDAGLALRKIVERDATPNEIASALYGGSQAGRTGLSVRIHDRLREALPEGHPAFAAIQQGLVSKVIDGGTGDVVNRIGHILDGEGRTLAAKVLTPEQRAGLDAFRTGTIQARRAQEAIPDWVRKLGDQGFDPNRVTSDLFGSGIPGARPGQPEFARGLKSFLGPDSPDWSNLRQAAWLRLTQHGEGPALSPAKEAARIRAFTEGEGKGLATVMFDRAELALMNRYADAVKVTETPKGGRLPDGGRAASLAGQVFNLVAGAAAFKALGPAAAGAAYAAKPGSRILQGGLTASRAARSFNEGAPRVAPPPPAYAPLFGSGAGIGAGLLSPNVMPDRR